MAALVRGGSGWSGVLRLRAPGHPPATSLRSQPKGSPYPLPPLMTVLSDWYVHMTHMIEATNKMTTEPTFR